MAWSTGGLASESKDPPWKKELLRRRQMQQLGWGRPANSNSSSFNSQQTGARFHPRTAVKTMRLVETHLRAPADLPLFSSAMVEEKPCPPRGGSHHLRHRPVKQSNGTSQDGPDYQSDSSEELQYGPGIVNKLRTKYLSMTLRESGRHASRPSLNNLRRATSLENMLENEQQVSNKPTLFVKKSLQQPVNPGVKNIRTISPHHAKYLGLTKGESMKRARSMDALFKPAVKPLVNGNVGTPPSIINEDIVIVEKDPPRLVEDTELPPPDVVKQTMKIFEKSPMTTPTSRPPSRGSPRTSPAKVAPTKPQLSPKPVIAPEKRQPRPKRVFPVVTSTTNKSIALPVRPPVRCSPVQTPVSPVSPDPLKGSKFVSKASLDGITKDSTSVTFSFTETPTKSYLPRRPTSAPLAQATNSTLVANSLNSTTSSPTSPTDSPKRVAVIRPVCTSTPIAVATPSPPTIVETVKPSPPLVIEKTFPQEVVSPIVKQQLSVTPPPLPTNQPSAAVLADPSPRSGDSNSKNSSELENTAPVVVANRKKNESLWTAKKSWQSQNTMVFNFSGRQSVPDYIENDGLHVQPKFNGSGVTDETDNEEDWEPPTSCNVTIIGGNILINGKSNLRNKDTKSSKTQLRRIQFNDEATLFEYPSEESMNEVVTPPVNHQPPPSSPPPPPSNPKLPTGGTAFSSYTPCKTKANDEFELGVTPRQMNTNHSNSVDSTTGGEALINGVGSAGTTSDVQTNNVDYLKPVGTSHETAWSQETASDILF